MWCRVLVATVLLVSCSGGGAAPATAPSSTAAGAEVLYGLCSGVVTADLGGGKLCADSGFRMDSGSFSFANWGRSDEADDNVTVQTLVDLFGHSQVCMPGPATECVLRPRATQALHDWNVALTGGRCEGMAVLSQRIFLRYDTPQDFDGTFATASEVPRSARDLAATLVHWWATQFVPEVADEAAASRTKDPATIVAELIPGIANRSGHTIGIYHRGSGHSLTPYAVTRRDDTWVVHVYDNNDPREPRELHVRPSGNMWTYAGPNGTWTGTTGTLELTPMWVRNEPFSCPFCSGDTEDTVVTVGSPDGAAAPLVAIDAGADGVIEQTGQGFLNTVEGASIEPAKGSSGESLTVHIPASVVGLRIELRGTDGVPHADATVTVRREGHPHIQVRGVAPSALTGSATVSAPVITAENGRTTVLARTGSVRVMIAGDSNLGSVTLDEGDALEVSRLRTAAGAPSVAEVMFVRDGSESRVMLELAPQDATDTELSLKSGVLTATAAATAARRVSAPRRVRTEPVAPPGQTATTPAGTVPSVDVTLPG